MSELRKRVLTGVLGIVFILGLIGCGHRWGICFLMTALSLGSIFEFSNMIFGLSDALEKRRVLLGISLALLLPYWSASCDGRGALIVCFIGLFIYFLFITHRHPGEQSLNLHFRELTASLFALVYLVLLPSYFLKIYELPWGVHWSVLLFLIIWSVDSGGYFIGKQFGRRLLYPIISPKKTWEGALGGLCLGSLIACCYRLVIFQEMSWLMVVSLSILVGIFAQLGDLCESFLKRAFGRKDSGCIFPGHGGFLDRFDGVLLGLPIMYWSIRLLG